MTLDHFSSRYYFKIFIKLNLKIFQVFDLYLACPLFISYASAALSRSVFSKTRVIVWTQILFFASRAWPVNTASLWLLRHDIGIFFKIARVAELLFFIKELSVSVLPSLAVFPFKLAGKIPVVVRQLDFSFESLLFLLYRFISLTSANSLFINN